MALLEQATATTQPANPVLPFLPPTLADQAFLSRYSMIGACSVLIWDILDNLRADRRLIRDYSIRLPTVVYFISRIGTLGFALSSVMTVTAEIGASCEGSTAKVLIGFFYPISAPSTSLLFLIRLRAVYHNSRSVSIAFTLLWLILFAASMLFPFGFVLINIAPEKDCFVSCVHQFIIAPVIIAVVYDTLVLLAVSWKLMENTHMDRNIRTGFRLLIFGDYLPAFSRALLQDAQLYYAITVPVSMATAITFFIPNSSLVVRVMFTLPNNVLLNIMACRVFRKTKFGLTTPDPAVSKSAFMEGTSNDFQITA